jgi:spore maturation protein CgeB
MNIVILGLSITSSWGNGHATTYRSLVTGLAARGHRVLFLERDVPWYAQNRDQPHPPGVRTELYDSTDQLFARYETQVRTADLVIVGSFVPEGAAVGEWVNATAEGITAFYDIDTPVTLEKLERGECDYVTPSLIARYDLYLSFTGGPTLHDIERRFGSPCARPLYCSVDPALYTPQPIEPRWHLGYLGTWSEDRQPALEHLMLEPARRWHRGRFCVAGPLYPEAIAWPANVERIVHLSPDRHARFYNSQRFTLNVTRAAMKRAGFSPSVRLFEAAACGVPIVSDWWPGLDTILEPGREILLSTSPDDTLRYLRDYSNEWRMAIGDAARGRILKEHTSERRALELEKHAAAVRTKAAPA